MPRLIDCADEGVLSLAECADRLAVRGFDPHDEESLLHAARDLRRLGNDPRFLGDLLVAELERGFAADADESGGYGPQVIMLADPGGDSFLRANIWPAASEAVLRASGGDAFAFGLPHDHNFSFLTLGYFGPGYRSDYYTFDYEGIAGWSGEPAHLEFVERGGLNPGEIVLYRAHRDVHSQIPPEAMSVSINVMHMSAAQGWFDQYAFNTGRDTVSRIVSQGPSEVILRMAVALGDDGARGLAEDFGHRHPSDRMRLAAWDALALSEADAAAREAVWRSAEASGNRLLAGEARRRLANLAA
ncbi:MAG: transposase [Sphingomonadales bacterium]|nr:transposase [Sphingomonadales bacterium]MDE2568564.1 transposase [Sphingomonadales bacterium]